MSPSIPTFSETLLYKGTKLSSRLRFVLEVLCEQYGWSLQALEPKALSLASFELALQNKEVAQQAFVQFSSHPLLDEGIKLEPSTLLWGEVEGIPCPVENNAFAGAFYLLSAYEEYFVDERDQHGRVPAASLRVVASGFAERPLADRLLAAIAHQLWQAAKRPGVPQPTHLRGLSTLDIDSGTAMHGKPLHRRLAVLAREVLKFRTRGSFAAVKSLFGDRDPYDTFAMLADLHREFDLKPLVFLLLGYDTPIDPGYPAGDTRYEKLIDQLQAWVSLGLHPSYHTAEDGQLLSCEADRFSALTGHQRVLHSRQHFLRIAWPQTLRNLEDLGVGTDYSLGWPDALGFRLGTARSVLWYDLRSDRTSTLRLRPPHAMEATARHYLRLSPKQFVNRCASLAEECRHSNAGLHVIWHNSNLGPLHGWGVWRSAYREILQLVASA